MRLLRIVVTAVSFIAASLCSVDAQVQAPQVEEHMWDFLCANAGYQREDPATAGIFRADYCHPADSAGASVIPDQIYDKNCAPILQSRLSWQAGNSASPMATALDPVFPQLSAVEQCGCMSCIVGNCLDVSYTGKTSLQLLCNEFANLADAKYRDRQLICNLTTNATGGSNIFVVSRDKPTTVTVSAFLPYAPKGDLVISENAQNFTRQVKASPDSRNPLLFKADFVYDFQGIVDNNVRDLTYNVTAPKNCGTVIITFKRKVNWGSLTLTPDPVSDIRSPVNNQGVTAGPVSVITFVTSNPNEQMVKFNLLNEFGEPPDGQGFLVFSSSPSSPIPVDLKNGLSKHFTRSGTVVTGYIEDPLGNRVDAPNSVEILLEPTAQLTGKACSADGAAVALTFAVQNPENTMSLTGTVQGGAAFTVGVNNTDSATANVSLPQSGAHYITFEKTATYQTQTRGTWTAYFPVRKCKISCASTSKSGSSPLPVRSPKQEDESDFCEMCEECDVLDPPCIPLACCQDLPMPCDDECFPLCPEKGQIRKAGDCSRCVSPPAPCDPPACCPERPDVCKNECLVPCPDGFKPDPDDCKRCTPAKDMVPPFVQITSPESGTTVPAGSSVTITALFMDSYKTDTGVVSGFFIAGGGALAGGPSPEEFSVSPTPELTKTATITTKADLTGVDDKTVSVVVSATDAAGNIAFDAISLNVEEICRVDKICGESCCKDNETCSTAAQSALKGALLFVPVCVVQPPPSTCAPNVPCGEGCMPPGAECCVGKGGTGACTQGTCCGANSCCSGQQTCVGGTCVTPPNCPSNMPLQCPGTEWCCYDLGKCCGAAGCCDPGDVCAGPGCCPSTLPSVCPGSNQCCDDTSRCCGGFGCCPAGSHCDPGHGCAWNATGQAVEGIRQPLKAGWGISGKRSSGDVLPESPGVQEDGVQQLLRSVLDGARQKQGYK